MDGKKISRGGKHVLSKPNSISFSGRGRAAKKTEKTQTKLRVRCISWKALWTERHSSACGELRSGHRSGPCGTYDGKKKQLRGVQACW